MEELTPAQQAKVEALLLKKFRKAISMNNNGDGAPCWKNIFFILDMLGRGDFYGTLVLKVLGCVCKDVRVTDRTFRVNEMYRDCI